MIMALHHGQRRINKDLFRHGRGEKIWGTGNLARFTT
jgi:hypothetical protein